MDADTEFGTDVFRAVPAVRPPLHAGLVTGNPYPDGSPEAEQFAEGQRAAVLTAQDAEE